MSKETVLIVEDDTSIAILVDHLLKRSGYSVLGIVASGENAVVMAGELRPDIVVTDVELIGPMDGIEAAAIIRARYDIPVIYLTSCSDEPTLRRAIATDPNGYVLKPVRANELLANVQMALHKSKLEAMRQREHELLHMLTSVDQGIVALSAEGSVAYMNPLAQAALGVTRSEVQNMRVNEIMDRLDHGSPATLMRDVPLNGEDGTPTGRLLVLDVTG